MKSFQIAIIDDDEIDAGKVDKITRDVFMSNQDDFKIEIYHRGEDLLWDLQDGHYFDIYLIDIELDNTNGMNGLEGLNGLLLAGEIRKLYDEPYIVFVTASEAYSKLGYGLDVWRYITKDIMKKHLPLALAVIRQKILDKEYMFYVIERQSGAIQISYEDIYYFKREGKNAVISTNIGILKERKALSRIMDNLQDDCFFRADRNCIVNIRHILQLGDYTAVMRNGDVLEVSIMQFQNLKKKITAYWSKNKCK